eukprot:scaffold3.g6639.t1
MAKRPPKRTAAPKHKLLRAAAADGACAAALVLISSTFVKLTPILAAQLKLSPTVSGLGLLTALLLVMVPISKLLGGAANNPALNAALYVAGQGTFKEHIVRVVGQAAGGIAAAAAAHLLLPSDWQHTLSSLALGLRPGSDLLSGVACEFVLGSVLAFTILCSGDLNSRFWQVWLPTISTLVAIHAGQSTSGPSLNPVYTLSWHVFYGLQTPAEHLLVYWAAPLLSGVFGGFAYLGFTEFQRRRLQKRKAE